MGVLLVKMILLLLSLAGYCRFLQKRGLEVAFAPVVTVAVISLVLYLGGFLGLLSYLVPVIYVGGFLLGALSIEWDHPPKTVAGKHDSDTIHDALVYGFFFLGCMLIFFRLKDELVKFEDSYGHWALIVKEMLSTGRFPSAPDSFIIHNGYPPGTGVFLYYVCRVTEATDGMMHVGQAIILISCLCTFFAFVKRQLVLCGTVIMLGSIYLLILNVPVNLLPVDTVLSLLAIASFAVLLYYRSSPGKALGYSTVLIAFLCIVKSSGIFFALLHSILAMGMLQFKPEKTLRDPRKQKAWILLVELGVPVAIFLLWNWYMSHAFPGGSVSRHSFTLENCLKVFGEKTLTDVVNIVKKFVTITLSPRRYSASLVALLGMFLLGHWRRKKQGDTSGPDEIRYLKWGIISYCLYLVALLGMYLFSMPLGEALWMSHYYRYCYIIVEYLVGIGVIYGLLVIQKTQKGNLYTHVVLPGVLIVSLIPITHLMPSLVQRQTVEMVYGKPCEPELGRICREYNVPEKQRYCIIHAPGSDYVEIEEAMYVLFSDKLLFVEMPEQELTWQQLDDYDYLILVSEDETALQHLDSLGLPRGQRVYELAEFR